MERTLHRSGATLVAGVDEVGRGALAGPVMAGAVILPPDLNPSAPWLQNINDSKNSPHCNANARPKKFISAPWPWASVKPARKK